MNCMELDFATKVELEHWMATFEEKVVPKVVKIITQNIGTIGELFFMIIEVDL